MNKSIYCGSNKRLYGLEAAVRTCPDTGRILAQFDDATLFLGHGWHRFPAADFAIIGDEFDTPWLT